MGLAMGYERVGLQIGGSLLPAPCLLPVRHLTGQAVALTHSAKFAGRPVLAVVLDPVSFPHRAFGTRRQVQAQHDSPC